jgi:enoyl-CoA hydratase
MTAQGTLFDDGRYEIVIDAPPVNAFSIVLLREITRLLGALPDDARVVILRAERTGFSAGGDIKEMEQLSGFDGIIGQIRDGLACCIAIEQCPVPVIAAVHGYCYGIGVLVVGVCDIVVAAEGTVFILNEIDNGAASGAIQALGLLPEKRMRAALFTGAEVRAEEMHAYGTIHAVVPTDRLLEEAAALAATIAAKVPAVVRAMKGAINRSTERDLIGKYRTEASYTYELHMSGAAAAARGAWWNSQPSTRPDESGRKETQ